MRFPSVPSRNAILESSRRNSGSGRDGLGPASHRTLGQDQSGLSCEQQARERRGRRPWRYLQGFSADAAIGRARGWRVSRDLSTSLGRNHYRWCDPQCSRSGWCRPAASPICNRNIDGRQSASTEERCQSTVTEHPRISLAPDVLVGKPVIRGTRLSVEFVIGLMADGWSETDILGNYPGISHDDIIACLGYARDALSSEKVFPSAA